MKFYRLHKKEIPTKGIYQGLNFWKDRLEVTERHPLATEDAILKEFLVKQKTWVDDYYYGFGSLEQMWAWFYHSNFNNACSRNEIVLSVYHIDGRKKKLFCNGNSQMIVSCAEFERIADSPIETYHIPENFPRP